MGYNKDDEIVLNLTDSSKTIKNFFYLTSSPIQKTFWKAGDNISGFFKAISVNRDSKNEIDNLKLTIEELILWVFIMTEMVSYMLFFAYIDF